MGGKTTSCQNFHCSPNTILSAITGPQMRCLGALTKGIRLHPCCLFIHVFANVTPLGYRSVPFPSDPLSHFRREYQHAIAICPTGFSGAIRVFDEVGNEETFFLIFFHVLNRLESVALAVSCIPTRSLITVQDSSLFMFPLYSKEKPERNITRMQDCAEKGKKRKEEKDVHT